MDFSGSPTQTTEVIMTISEESNKTVGAAQEEYDPSHPLDSSDEEEQHIGLQFENDVDCSEVIEPPEQPPPIVTETQTLMKSSLSTTTTNTSVLPKEPDIDLNSIPMPSDEYRRPAIQFSIPTRHKLMSISSLIKRQKGVMKKQDKGGGLCYSSEISKAFHKSDTSGDGQGQGASDSGDEDRPKISLVQEIFGSDDEENPKDSEDTEEAPIISEGMDTSSQPSVDSVEEIETLPAAVAAATTTTTTILNFQALNEDANKRWKTVEETSRLESPDRSLRDNENVQNCTPIIDAEDNSVGELRISIKPPSELMEKPSNDDEGSSEFEAPAPNKNETNESERGKENQLIVLECVSEDDMDEIEVTYVGTRKTTSIQRPKLGQKLPTEKLRKRSISPRKRSLSPRKRSLSPLNGFEEGEIIEQADRKKKKAKKKKSKKRKRSKDSRVSSKLNSERSNSIEKKSFSENSDGGGNGKEVSWRKPSKMTKTRNYRNGKRESEEKHTVDRLQQKHDDSSHKKGRSPSRYSGTIEKSRSRRHRSLSGGRLKSRSGSRDSSSRWNGRSRGTKRTNRAESHKSRSSVSNHSSPSQSRSRSLSKKKVKRRHSPSPIRKHRNGRSTSRSPVHLSKSPRPNKRNKSNGTEITKRDKIRERSKSPVDPHPSKRSSKSKPEEPVVDEGKKKGKKEKTSSEELDKEKKKKRKRREKSLSPVKAIVADGDSIVVSLSFQKTKEEVSRTSKVTASSKNENNSEKEKSNSNTTDHSEAAERPGGNSKSTPRKGTIMIHLDSPPSQEFRRSPDIIVLSDEFDQRATKTHDSKKGQDPKFDGKSLSSGLSQRTEGLDFVSSSHDCSVDNTQTTFPAVPDSKVAASPAERATSASKSPYKFSEYFVSSTCDVGKTASPSVEGCSPKHYTPSKVGESTEASLSQKVSDNSPFPTSEAPRPGNSTENGPENSSFSPSPEPPHILQGKGSSGLSSKPMIGNIPGLFPSGFSTGPGGMVTSAPIIIPAPPRIIPSTNSQPNLLNPNVLVSVASALYAPLLAAKQHHNANVSSGQANAGNSGLSRHNQTGNIFSKNSNSHNQALGLFNNNRTNNGRGGEGDSPFSPNSSDGDDLFEPPGDGGNNSGTPTKKSMGSDPSASGTAAHSPTFKYPGDGGGNEKRTMFDTLFSTAPKKSGHSKYGKKKNSSHLKRSKQKRGGGKRPEVTGNVEKNGDGEISARLNEDVPTSAVALKMKEKFLKKLNRQERVVEEVKLSLKPHYSKKHVTKDEYKEILRRAVPKICHNKAGEINPHKIKTLVEQYVKKFRENRKMENKIK